jgi:hypothetical protein
MTVNLQVRLFVRTLSVPVRGIRRFASVAVRTYNGQARIFTLSPEKFGQVSGHSDG